MRAPFVVAEGVPEAGAGGVHAGQAAVPEVDRADQEHQGHPCSVQEVGPVSYTHLTLPTSSYV